MLDELTEPPIYEETLGLVSAEVYKYNGVYSIFLVGDQVMCFLGNYNSLKDCQEEIKLLSRLANSFPLSVSSSLVSYNG